MMLHRIRFSGGILERGFWLYVWRIECHDRMFFYVGRTGDRSSKFAASPFSRLSQHLDVRKTAAANMLMRHVRRLKLDPLACVFELLALGPLFPEQSTLELHRMYRDRIAPLEAALAAHLCSKGLEVVGNHSAKGAVDQQLLAEVPCAFGEALVV